MEVADDRVTAIRLGEPDSKPMTWREIEVEVKSSDPEAADLLETVGKVLRRGRRQTVGLGVEAARVLGVG